MKNYYSVATLALLVFLSFPVFAFQQITTDTVAVEEPLPDAVVVSVDTLNRDSSKQDAIVVKYYQAVDPQPQPVSEPEPQPAKPKEKKHSDIRTISGSGHHGGGYGALGIKISSFNDESLTMAGARGAWVINRALAFGVDLWGVIPTNEYDDLPSMAMDDLSLLGGYGGFLLEPILFSNQVIHLTFPVSAGAGWLGYVPSVYGGESSEIVDQDVFWYVEPGAAVELNLARCFRLNFAVSKRFTQDLRLIGTANDEFDELNYTLTMKIGRF
ncbi:hypothetical protein KO507_09770 [Gilvimarinus agarilyticus]|nr:hypothetical protein [Gilvimarinus agarilyticus]